MRNNSSRRSISAPGKKEVRRWVHQHGNIQAKLVLDFFRRYCPGCNRDDCKIDLVAELFYQGFEVWNIESRARAIRVKEMKQKRFASFAPRSIESQVNRLTEAYVPVVHWHRRWQSIHPLCVVEHCRYHRKDGSQPDDCEPPFHR